MSYVFVQAIWMLCVLLTPVGIHFYPTKLWAVPFCLVTVANGLHMIFFRYEYNAVVRRAAGLIPYARFISPAQYDPRYFVPFGGVYALFGIVSVALVLMA